MSSKKIKKISIVIPVYNEEKTIEKVISRVLNAPTLGLKKEIIVVDDGSTDKTTNILKKISKGNIKKIFLKKNRGKGYALREGFKKATGDIILVQDADLEYHPEEYPLLIEPFLKKDALVVYGSREISGKNKHSYATFHAGGRFVTAITNFIFSSNLTDEPTGYKAFYRELLQELPLKCIRFEFCPEVTGHVLKRGTEIHEVPITYSPRDMSEGKKIKPHDGIEAIWTLIRVRFDL